MSFQTTPLLPTILTTILLLLFTPINAQWRDPRPCVSASTTNPHWVLNAPFQWFEREYYPYVQFSLFNAAANTKSTCYSAGSDLSKGECYFQESPEDWLVSGTFEFDGTNAHDKNVVQTLNITQRWTCLKYWEKENDVNFTGTATVTFPKRSDKAWVCESVGREGELNCGYTLPIILSPKVS